MGYDMYIKDADHESGEAYFRLNVFGMSRYAEAMGELGMLATAYQRPAWPELPEDITWDDVEAVRYPEDNADATVKAAAVEYEKASEAHLAWHPDAVEGICVHKFGSNDGWLVTPEEIAKALETYRANPRDEVTEPLGDYWREWIDYLERAQKAGGFRVH